MTEKLKYIKIYIQGVWHQVGQRLHICTLDHSGPERSLPF